MVKLNMRDAFRVHDDPDVLCVDLMVVSRAEQYKIVQARRPALTPVLDVMSLGPADRAIALRESIPAVPDSERGS